MAYHYHAWFLQLFSFPLFLRVLRVLRGNFSVLTFDLALVGDQRHQLAVGPGFALGMLFLQHDTAALGADPGDQSVVPWFLLFPFNLQNNN